MARYSAVWPTYAAEWDRMTVNTSRIVEFEGYAKFAIANKARYVEVEKATGVPWAMIAVIHRREGDANFNTYLGNGQSLARRTTEVPSGRGPFSSFQAGAVDALKVDQLTTVQDWRLEKQLYYLTSFNGWGYWPKPSPYIWGGTNIQVIGKYVRDYVYDGSVWDTQPGCAPMLYMIAKIDPSVVFVRETPEGVATSTPAPVTTVQTVKSTTQPQPPKQGWFDWILFGAK